MDHEQILSSFTKGLKTHYSWQSRPFIYPSSKYGNKYEVILGGTQLYLTDRELEDLCGCVDIIAEEYKERIVKAEDVLETQEFERIINHDTDLRGFVLATIDRSDWDKMRDFANEYEDMSGNSKWHIFARTTNEVIRIPISDHRDRGTCVIFFLKPDYMYWTTNKNKVDIIYQDPDFLDSYDRENWVDNVGKSGVWTARHASEWLAKFGDKLGIQLNMNMYGQNNYTAFSEIENLRQLHRYIYDISRASAFYHNSYIGSHVKIRTKVTIDYFTSFVHILRKATLSKEDLYFVKQKLISSTLFDETIENLSSFDQVWDMCNDEVKKLEKLSPPIHSAFVLRIMSEAFLALLDQVDSYHQHELNKAKEATETLWKEMKFYERWT